MLSGKTVKFILYEVLQFAALTVPIFVIMERFARIIHIVQGANRTAYWLVVAVSIAYVTTATLLVWAPLKYMILKRRRFISDITQWRPTALAYIVLCTFPCFAILITSSKVQADNDPEIRDHFDELPVSLVLVCLICVDITERIRPCRLLGSSDGLDPELDMSGPVLTHLEAVTTVTAQLHTDEGQNGLTQGQPEARNGSTPGSWRDLAGSRASSAAYLYTSSSRPRSYSGPLRFLWRRDGRAEAFVDSFMFWLDTVELVRVAKVPSVFFSAWVFPVYIVAFLSTLRVAITPNNPLLSSAGFALQDLPFFVIRVALIAVFGFVTPVLYPLKNVLVILTFIYFTFLTRLRIFRRQAMF
ncbi:transmembrane protein 236 [Sparus aurata]|uniref:Transmembrane protein 236 n=1 Tax=Sparus aurata TaxID=8175 RepID=A0A671U5Q5_SPAAU|nr:transmembrane protein 236-like [Sparus aurata]